ncbi:hypothetical protein SAMN05216262_11096 [Colwellia chukchiensis]|uniref:Flagellar basal body rod FlgEFG protein C-terminal n=1 Tax=Colwellia chukchiensis TaxID=641665 RepID=A0A1H7Q040_9GAMM|nr:hypothetical protein [Colwellia chukchiensis]SEL41206.1 hypothetical protein SAMN05216262_11096 [Colwellia chukchiensis]
MEIQSAFNVGVQGFQKASADASKAAENIATSVSTRPEVAANTQENISINSNQADNESVSLSQSVVDLRVAEFQAKASAKVVESADENLGTLIDVRV